MPQPWSIKSFMQPQADIGFDLTIKALARPAGIFSYEHDSVSVAGVIVDTHLPSTMRGKFLFMDLLRLLGIAMNCMYRHGSLVQKVRCGICGFY